MKIDIVSHEGLFFKSGSGTYVWSLELPRLSQGGTAAADGYSWSTCIYCKQRSMCDSGKDAMYTNSKVFLNEKSG